MLALVRQSRYVCVLMAVELEYPAQLTLLVVLALQADTNIVDVYMQLLNARFVVQRQLIILLNAISI